MELNNIDEIALQSQAAAAGFASPEVYIHELLKKDAHRLAVQQGLKDVGAGKYRSFDEFDKEFRQKNELPTQS